MTTLSRDKVTLLPETSSLIKWPSSSAKEIHIDASPTKHSPAISFPSDPRQYSFTKFIYLSLSSSLRCHEKLVPRVHVEAKHALLLAILSGDSGH